MDCINTLLEFDKKNIWHPYTNIKHPLPTYLVESCNGVYIHLSTGEKLIDGMSSWWTQIHGYNHPVLNQALLEQSQKMSHVMFGGLTHKPAIELASLLIEITPAELTKIFFADSGSIAVEVAMKMALQYWRSKGNEKKSRFLTLSRGYHGDTTGAMSVCDPDTGMHHIFSSYLPQQIFMQQPSQKYGSPACPHDIAKYKEYFENHHKETAALILEPLVQGAGAMWFYSAEYLQELRKLCTEYNVLLICDEIATGFGRCGTELFASDTAHIQPDIMCIGKALTGGYISLAATLCSDKIAEGISNGKYPYLMHGPTYMGNPLACALGVASTNLLIESNWQDTISRIENKLKQLYSIESHAKVKDVRVLGGIGVVEMHESVEVAAFQKTCIQKGLWIRPFSNYVYIMPPYIITDSELERLVKGLIEVAVFD